MLFAINDTKLSDLAYSEVKELLGNRNILQKSLKFMKYEEYMRQKYDCIMIQPNLLMSL